MDVEQEQPETQVLVPDNATLVLNQLGTDAFVFDSTSSQKKRRGKTTVVNQQGGSNHEFATKAFMVQMFQQQNETMTKRQAESDDKLAKLLAPISQQLQQTQNEVQQHSTTLQSLVAIEADQTWRRQKLCNVKFSMDRQSQLTDLHINRGLTAAQQHEQIKKFLMWLRSHISVDPMPTGHRIIEPASSYWSPFYIVRFPSEAQADFVRSHYQLFVQNKIYASADLTPLEQERKKTITALLKAHWNLPKIPNGRFIRDCIKVCIDNDQRMTVCNLEQVREYIAQNRIRQYIPKNGLAGQS